MKVAESYEKGLRSKAKAIGPMFALKAWAKWRDAEPINNTALAQQVAPTILIQLTGTEQQQNSSVIKTTQNKPKKLSPEEIREKEKKAHALKCKRERALREYDDKLSGIAGEI